MRVLLVSTYELGHQPVHVASPAAALLASGHDVRALDLSVQPWSASDIDWADALAFSVPMHTAMRLAVRAAGIARAHRPAVPIAFYGLYAAVAHDRVVGAVADQALVGEYEPHLVQWVDDLAGAATMATSSPVITDLTRSTMHVPARHLLPSLDSYARLAVGDELRLVGAVEASHGCAHRCKHCPVPVVYDGRVRTVAEQVVIDDIEQLVNMGAQHITFTDPDFLNAVHHGRRVIGALHTHFPTLTFDITTKIEHILRHDTLWPEFAAAGCLFVVSAVESVNDDLLHILDKGHTAADASRALALLRASGIEMRPSFLPFTPWSTVDDVAALCEFTAAHDLIGNVDPIQFTLRLLLPDGSLLLEHAQPFVTGYDGEGLTWTWRPTDPRVDAVQQELAALVEAAASAGEPNEATFEKIAATVGADVTGHRPAEIRPRLTEPWFCCAEPVQGQYAPLELA